MIRLLQKKFILTAQAAVSVLLLVLICAINGANIWVTVRQTDQQLEMLADTELQISRQETGTDGYTPGEERFSGPLPFPKNEKKGGLMRPPMDKDLAMSLRFFTVSLDHNGQIIRSDLSRISSVSETEAQTYAQLAVRKEQSSGYLEQFKYKVLSSGKTENKQNNKYKQDNEIIQDDETILLFLDVSGQFHSIWTILVLSAGIAAGCWLCMLLFVVLLSQKAIRPIARNIQKQKQFVTDAGHEIKTPLAIIQANLDAMELISGENKWSRNIRSQTVRLHGLMQNLLTLAKMEEDMQQLPMEHFSFSELLEESIQPFYEAATLKGILIETKICADTGIYANREYMQRLLSILFDNAVKYTDSDGSMIVSLKKTEHKVILKVKNTCSELPQQDAEKLFDRFYRGDSARTQKNGGYGIGLSAAYAIVKAHKGEISAAYADGNAIEFTVKIDGH